MNNMGVIKTWYMSYDISSNGDLIIDLPSTIPTTPPAMFCAFIPSFVDSVT